METGACGINAWQLM